jgi:hypothetical protein
LEAKLKLAKGSLERCLKLLAARQQRREFGISNPELEKQLADVAQQLEEEYESAMA